MGLFRRYGSFEGGIDLPGQKEATLREPIAPAPRAASLRVPLAPCGGAAAKLTAATGSHVAAGQRIAEAAGEDGVDVYAPLSGRLGEVVECEMVLGDGVVLSPAVEIEAVSATQPIAPLPGEFDWRGASGDDLLERLAGGGLVRARGRVEPLVPWARRARRKKCRVLIANAVESQPFLTAEHRLLAEHGSEVVRGLAILSAALGVKRTILAVNGRMTGDYRGLEEPARACGVTDVAMHPIYPIGHDAILVKVLTGRETPLGGEGLDVRAAVTDAATCFAVYRWVACGVPQTGRVVTLSGPAAPRKGNFFVPFGASCEALAAGEDAFAGRPSADRRDRWLIHGGPMTGRLCGPGAVVTACTDGLVSMPAAAPVVPAPCIRCGWCIAHCPARLNVAALNDLYELGQLRRAERLGAAGCLGCGVCTYLCPAKLPLSQRVKQLQRMIRSARNEMPLFHGEEARA